MMLEADFDVISLCFVGQRERRIVAVMPLD